MPNFMHTKDTDKAFLYKKIVHQKSKGVCLVFGMQYVWDLIFNLKNNIIKFLCCM